MYIVHCISMQESSLLLDEPRTTIIPTKQQQPSLIEQPSYSVKEEQTTNHHLPPLEQQFKRPPPGKNRRKPSQGHLVKRNVQIETPPVPPLDLPKNEDSAPVPSAPPGGWRQWVWFREAWTCVYYKTSINMLCSVISVMIL